MRFPREPDKPVRAGSASARRRLAPSSRAFHFAKPTAQAKTEGRAKAPPQTANPSRPPWGPAVSAQASSSILLAPTAPDVKRGYDDQRGQQRVGRLTRADRAAGSADERLGAACCRGEP